MKNFIKILFILLIIFSSKVFADDEIKDITKSIVEVQEKISNLAEPISEEAKIIDQAISEINKATDFVKNEIQSNPDEAIKGLEFIDRTLGDVENLVPKEGASDMSNLDMTKLSEKDLKEVTKITSSMTESKKIKMNAIFNDMISLNDSGLQTFEIVKNLTDIGINTASIDLDFLNKKKIETWSKKEWADSYNGSLLTSANSKIITDKEIESNLIKLDEKIVNNKILLGSKKAELDALKNQTNPINTQISKLSQQKENIITKYSFELIALNEKQLSVDEFNTNKSLSEELDIKLESINSQINNLETKNENLNLEINKLSSEIENNDFKVFDLNNQIELNNKVITNTQNQLISKKIELDSLKKVNLDLNPNLEPLNSRLQQAKLARDFSTVDIDKNLDKEVEALNNFGHLLGDVDSSTFDAEIEFSIKEVDVILSGDPIKHQVFDLEKYGTIAGLSKDLINKGTLAIRNDNFDVQKEVYSEIFQSLSKNKRFNVQVPNNAELNVFIAEQKFENEIVELIKSNPTNINFDPNENLVVWNKGAVTPDVYKDAVNSIAKNILAESGIKKRITEVEDLRKNLYDTNDWLNQANILRMTGTQFTPQMSAEYNKKFIEMQKSHREYLSINTYELISAESNAAVQARNIVWEQNNKLRQAQVKAVENLNRMIDDKLSTIPSYDQNKINAVKSIINVISPDSPYLAVNPSPELFAAQAKATLYDNDGKMLKAFNIANDTGVKSVLYDTANTGKIRNLKNYNLDKSNIELAAEIQSTLNGTYSHETDGYIAAKFYQGIRIEKFDKFTPEEANLIKQELKQIYAKDDPKLSLINNEISKLNEQIININNQSQNINSNIKSLESEINNLNNIEISTKSKLTDLTKELQQNKDFLISKDNSLKELESKLNPVLSQINSLKNNKKDVENKLNIQIVNIENLNITEEEIRAQNKVLNDQYNKEIAEMDKQLSIFETELTSINETINISSNELNELKVQNPKIESEIKELNETLKNSIDIKADLAIMEAKEYNIYVSEKVIESVAKLENKSIITINDKLNTYRIIDTNLLRDKASLFKIKGSMSINGAVYTAGAVQANTLFNFKEINEQGDLKIDFSEEAALQLGLTGKIIGGQQTYDSVYGSGSLGSWVLVDAKTGKQMTNPNTGHTGSIVCEGSTCGPTGTFGQEAAGFGGMYVMESLADQVTGNVAGKCSGGDCKFNISEEEVTRYMTTAFNVPEGMTTGYTGHVNGIATFKGQRKNSPTILSDGKSIYTPASGEIYTDKLNSLKSSASALKDSNTSADLVKRSSKAAREAGAANEATSIAAVDIDKNAITTNTAAAASATARSLDTVSGVAGDLANNLAAEASKAAATAAATASEANVAAAEAAQAVAAAAAEVAAEASAAAASAAAEAATQAATIAKEVATEAAAAAAEASTEVAAAAAAAAAEAGLDHVLDNVQSLVAEIQAATGGNIASIAQEVVDEYRNTSARKDDLDSLFKDEQGYYWSRSEVKSGDNVEWKMFNGQRRACQGSCAAE